MNNLSRAIPRADSLVGPADCQACRGQDGLFIAWGAAWSLVRPLMREYSLIFIGFVCTLPDEIVFFWNLNNATWLD
ncbi:MAG: hypothetical protein WA108_04605 [Thiobacillus sp.]